MDKSFITIRMPKELLANWLADLRSGKPAKGQGVLQILADPQAEGKDSFCCLGRLQIVAGDNRCELLTTVDKELVFRSLPTTAWLRKHRVQFYYLLTRQTADKSGIETVVEEQKDAQYPYVMYEGLVRSLTTLNDSPKFNLTFAQIADIIEAHAEGI